MICKCCFSESSEDAACCPVCKFPLMTILDERNSSEMEAAIKDYRRNFLKDITISVKTYTYNYTSAGLTVPETRSVKLADADALEHNVTLWSEREFAAVLSKRSFPLELEISDGSETRGVTLTVSPEKPISHARIGIELNKGFSVRAAIGTKDEFVYTEPVPLITK